MKKEYDWSGLRYHHNRPAEFSSFGIVKSKPGIINEESEQFYEAYLWLEKEVGFYPLFLAVGDTQQDIYMTGYQDSWRKLITLNPSSYRIKGEFPNYVLFSFKDLPYSPIYIDYDYWHIVLNSKDYKITSYEKRLIFKYSLEPSDWLRMARKHPCSVQAVVPFLDLTLASLVSVRNLATKRQLEKFGFKNVAARRIKVG